MIEELPNERAVVDALVNLPNPHKRIVREILEAVYEDGAFLDFSEVTYDQSEMDMPGVFMSEVSRLYLYRGHLNVPKKRLDSILGGVLSMMIPSDAELYKAVLAKKMPYKKLTRKVYKKAFT